MEFNEVSHCNHPLTCLNWCWHHELLLKWPRSHYSLLMCKCFSVSFSFQICQWSNIMDPLGARSQFVEVQSLYTWDQSQGVQDEVDGENHLREEEDKLTNHVNSLTSPFPFRQDINSKIVLLWVYFTLLLIYLTPCVFPRFSTNLCSYCLIVLVVVFCCNFSLNPESQSIKLFSFVVLV